MVKLSTPISRAKAVIDEAVIQKQSGESISKAEQVLVEAEAELVRVSARKAEVENDISVAQNILERLKLEKAELVTKTAEKKSEIASLKKAIEESKKRSVDNLKKTINPIERLKDTDTLYI